MADRVREPIQVYLTAEERAELDRKADAMGVSRSEALRRGIQAVGTTRAAGPLAELIAAGLVTSARAPGGGPPPRRPVAPLAELLRGLAADRDAR
jgi:hypothetical protein